VPCSSPERSRYRHRRLPIGVIAIIAANIVKICGIYAVPRESCAAIYGAAPSPEKLLEIAPPSPVSAPSCGSIAAGTIGAAGLDTDDTGTTMIAIIGGIAGTDATAVGIGAGGDKLGVCWIPAPPAPGGAGVAIGLRLAAHRFHLAFPVPASCFCCLKRTQ